MAPAAVATRRAPQAFHWVTALLMFVVIPLGWVFAEFKTKAGSPDVFEAPFPGSPNAYASMHKTIGLTIFVIVAARINLPRCQPTAGSPGPHGGVGTHHVARLALAALRRTHRHARVGLHFLVVRQISNQHSRVVRLSETCRSTEATGHIAAGVHLYTQFAVYALIVLHVAATFWHLVVRRDAILDRMLPRQSNAE